MPSFTTRVELHNSTSWQDYTKLHEAMRKQGFIQTIKADDGKVYELPPAEYNLIGEIARNVVLQRATAAATSVGFPPWKPGSGSNAKTSGILITESNGRTWDGLKPVQ